MAAFWFVFVLVIVAGYCIAFTRKGTVASTTLGANRKTLFNAADVNTVFDRIAAINDPKLKVDDKDAAKKILVLSSPVTFFTWGFLYPVYLHDTGSGTKIEVGISSKFFQWGPLVSRAHDQCAAAIEAALSVPTARVA
jgi:hypothetical protein